MAEKATLTLEAAKKSQEIERLQATVAQCTSDLKSLPQQFDRMRMGARENALASFRRRQDELRARVDGIITKKKQEASDLIDTFPGMESKEFAGQFEVQDLEAHLMEVYPREMIQDYVCMDPLILEDDEEAFRLYSSVESMVMSLSKGGTLISRVFRGITAGLERMTQDPTIGLKIVPAVLLTYIAGIFFLPFIFLFGFTLLGVASAAQGMFVKSLLRKLYSVKLYLNTAYDEDIFADNKATIMRDVNDFLDEAMVQYHNYLDSQEFVYDTSIDERLEHDYALAKKRLEQTLDLSNTAIQKLQEELDALAEQIDALEAAEREKAATARVEYLETVTWKREWLSRIFVDITPENKTMMLPFTKGNTLFYAKDPESLKEFSRLVTLQCLIHMHPDYATQVVLDYKYMGGYLTQFLTLQGKCLKLCMSDDEIRAQQDIITNEIRARTKNILSSSADLDAFNKLMQSYGSTGEYYAIIHIFGLESITNVMLNWFRNGPRVGYLFKFYWTYEELQALKDTLPLTAIQDFFEIGSNPIPRTPASVKRIAGLDS